MAIFEGAGVALVTPFKENGSVNYEVLESLIEEQIVGGTDCIVAMGTTGESATTSEEEHIQVIRFVCEVVNGRIPVVAGTGSNCTQTAVELSVEAEEAGADGVLLVSPYYNKATQNGLKAHFTKIANSIKIPAILYNVPSRTGVNIAPETIVDLCKNVENIVGVKEASGNFSAVAKILQLSGGYVDVYSGNDDQVVGTRRKGRDLRSLQRCSEADPRYVCRILQRQCGSQQTNPVKGSSADRSSVL